MTVASRPVLGVLGVACVLGACTTANDTVPARSATEQLIISTAADRGIEQINFGVPAGARTFVDSYIDGPDAKYVLGAIRDRLIRQGALPVADRGAADWIVELRAGALSMDQSATLFGLPSFDAPIPLTGATKTPEIALFKRARRVGVAKLAATSYPAKGGAAVSSGPVHGFSQATKWTVLVLISWSSDDITPDGKPD